VPSRANFRVRFLLLALRGRPWRLEYWAQQFVLSDLLFDNLVSDLQIFLLAKTVLLAEAAVEIGRFVARVLSVVFA
jgi:hypothetical protein